MGNEALADVDRFLTMISYLEREVARLLAKAALSEEEKQFIWDHIVIVPGKADRM
ncbi:hypothetical protein [Paenibacillus rigui]|uniref:hypothetical protein n=1 Tax=Paenibacillus rigui TaxID=554312 RepID=UPI0015C5940C|nr:hypothetical protein [Paenibacillus rigui]